MSREIKFRAFDKIKKKLIQPENGDFIKWHAMSNWKDCLELMQFTGLKDKNGKEIYEGDIVKYTGSIDSHNTDFIGEIQWWSGQSGIGFRYKSGRHTHMLKIGNVMFCEVIGNIYEHKHLLS